MTVFRVTMAAIAVFALAGCSAEASEDGAEQTAQAQEQTVQPPAGSGAAGVLTVEDVDLSWEIGDGSIAVTVTAPTDGWVAVGFEPTMAMKDADIIIGYVSGGEAFISDDWGDGPTSHKPDIDLGGTSDVTDISGSETDGSTTLSFTIPLDSGDGYDRVLTPGATVKILLAYGRAGADDFTGFHAWAETVETSL
jgi:hypothetical protein